MGLKEYEDSNNHTGIIITKSSKFLCVYTHMHVYEDQKLIQCISFSFILPEFWEKFFHWIWSLLIWLDWLAYKL